VSTNVYSLSTHKKLYQPSRYFTFLNHTFVFSTRICKILLLLSTIKRQILQRQLRVEINMDNIITAHSRIRLTVCLTVNVTRFVAIL